MKIAFISVGCASLNASNNGVKSQILTWKRMLESRGHNVDLINYWDSYPWKLYDAILIFRIEAYLLDFVRDLYKVNPRVFLAPILDPNYSMIGMMLKGRWGSEKLRLMNRHYAIRCTKGCVMGYLVRSDYEKKYLSKCFGVPKDIIFKVPLSYGSYPLKPIPAKENFCFHASRLTDEHKNVRRLIEAAKKYHFNLKLAGAVKNEAERLKLKSWIGDSNYIECLGYLTDEELEEYYLRAKVFALPSLFEGVGIVALEAAIRGCDIVITKNGGPKEYFDGYAKLVNPTSVNDIGRGIMSFLDGEMTYQPVLMKHITDDYSEQVLVEMLEKILSINNK